MLFKAAYFCGSKCWRSSINYKETAGNSVVFLASVSNRCNVFNPEGDIFPYSKTQSHRLLDVISPLSLSLNFRNSRNFSFRLFYSHGGTGGKSSKSWKTFQ